MEIKFKAYFKYCDKLKNVKQINWHKNTIIFFDFGYECEWCLDSAILLPYTNVKDNNKREIYLGDIYRRWWYPDYKDYEIEFNQGSFWLNDDALIDVRWDEYEYICNKYENRNVLK